jgi:hypothetical protein
MTAITVDKNNPSYTSMAGVLFNKNQTVLIQCPGGKIGSYIVPNSVTNIGSYAFSYCQSLTNVIIGTGVTSIGDEAFYYFHLTSITIPSSVTNIGDGAFSDCLNLTSVYFQGNAPYIGLGVFDNDNNATVYHLPETRGWGAYFGNIPTWNPQVQTSGPNFGMRTNQFGFNIVGNSNLVIVVEACANLASHIWSPQTTNTLTNGSAYFTDSQWTNYVRRYYRLRSP